MTTQTLCVICYDTPCDKRRRRFVQVLEEVADRVQWSVFEGRLDQSTFEATWQQLQFHANEQEDSIYCYRICATCRNTARSIGSSTRCDVEAFLIV